jgi:hypothetical protein
VLCRRGSLASSLRWSSRYSAQSRSWCTTSPSEQSLASSSDSRSNNVLVYRLRPISLLPQGVPRCDVIWQRQIRPRDEGCLPARHLLQRPPPPRAPSNRMMHTVYYDKPFIVFPSSFPWSVISKILQGCCSTVFINTKKCLLIPIASRFY